MRLKHKSLVLSQMTVQQRQLFNIKNRKLEYFKVILFILRNKEDNKNIMGVIKINLK